MVVSGVGDFAEGAVGLEEGVFALHDITVTSLVLSLVVAGVGVGHRVRVIVFRMSLQEKYRFENQRVTSSSFSTFFLMIGIFLDTIKASLKTNMKYFYFMFGKTPAS